MRLTPSLEVVSVMERSLCFINGALLHDTPLISNIALPSEQNTITNTALQVAPLVCEESCVTEPKRSDGMNDGLLWFLFFYRRYSWNFMSS